MNLSKQMQGQWEIKLLGVEYIGAEDCCAVFLGVLVGTGDCCVKFYFSCGIGVATVVAFCFLLIGRGRREFDDCKLYF